jgi:CheY-like chemotaxis protein
LKKAQRLEAIGTLAGGIAHDFNNILMGIQGNVSLALAYAPTDNPAREKLLNIEKHIEQGATLTRQLLGIARGGKYEIKPTNVNELLETCSEMFRRTRKETVIHKNFEKEVWRVEVDQGQIEQIILSIFVNSWQAMPGGGEIDIETRNIILDESFCFRHEINPGKYVSITVSDNGVGMDQEILDRAFDPFFTTKERSRGTGLGLASAYGIVKNHGGVVTASSKIGEGTTLVIYLPAHDSVSIQKEVVPDKILRGYETILLVDDEEIITDVGKSMLEELGYRALIARSGQEALDIYGEQEESISLVILDIIMPKMSGSETFQRLKTLNPNILVLLSSGYSMNGEATELMNQGCSGFIQKPFDLKKLSLKIREVLDEDSS